MGGDDEKNADIPSTTSWHLKSMAHSFESSRSMVNRTRELIKTSRSLVQRSRRSLEESQRIYSDTMKIVARGKRTLMPNSKFWPGNEAPPKPVSSSEASQKV
jgi:hypothetical protein